MSDAHGAATPGGAAQAENHDSLIRAFERYATLIAPLLRTRRDAVAAGDIPAGTISLDAGRVFVNAVIQSPQPADDAVAERFLTSQATDDLIITDTAGHRRPFYRPLLIYSALQTVRLRRETLPPESLARWKAALRDWCDLLEAEFPIIAKTRAAADGQAIANAAFAALALSVAGKVFNRDAWTTLASDAFGQLVRPESDAHPFLLASKSDHPETAWYHELAVLHAAASYAVQSGDRLLARCVSASADFIAREIQPDHATTQPLALFAFIWHAPARPLADQLLHAVRLHPADTASLILLADALYCLQLFL